MPTTIHTYADLLAYYDAENFAHLNRRIYKGTECGASISIYGTVAREDATPEDIAAAERAGFASARAVEYARILPLVQDAYRAASTEEQARIAAMDEDFYARSNPAPFMAWARTVVPDAFPETVTNPARVPVAYHNGRRAEIPASFLLTGFTIQSIVEGSDAEVNSDVFRAGDTTTEEIEAWIGDMEAEVDRLWDEANGVEDDGEDE